ncbi:MAG TPA: DUF1127 domain-containing protein [Roseiarcus sp.]|nr:DUF1127 domain-containing protein [Roseiarcus sp.]
MTMQISLPAAPWTCWRGHLRQARNWLGLIEVWRRRAQERRALCAMDLRELRDIGLTPIDARREAEKPFWRA